MKMKLEDVSNFIRDIVMIPVDATVKLIVALQELEEQMSVKGMVVAVLTGTICYCVINEIVPPAPFGDLFMGVITVYFGGGAIKYIQELKKDRRE